MKSGGFSATGPRAANEDSLFFRDFEGIGLIAGGITSFIMVSDGMGGYQCGDVASGLAVASAQSYIDQLLEMAQGNLIDLDPKAALAEIAQNAHDAICMESQSRGSIGMGATIVAAFVSSTHAWIAHIGDSRAYLVHGDTARQLTEDHSKVGRLLSHGVITEAEAQNHPERNRIERALGFGDSTPDFNEVDFGPEDVLLLCSDGVYTVLDSAQLCGCALQAGDPSSAAEAVVQRAIQKGTDDNSTAVVLMADGLLKRSVSRPARIYAATQAPLTVNSNPYQKPRHGEGGRSVWLIVLLAGVFIGVTAALLIGALYSASGEVGGGGPLGSQPTEPAPANNDQSGAEHAQQTADKNTYEEFLIPENVEVVLKYVDGDGMAKLFSYQPFGFEGAVTLRAGSSVLASVDSYPYGRPGKTYQRMLDEYVIDLRSDIERCKSGATSYNTSLAALCDTESYASLVSKLAEFGINTFDNTVAHLVIDALLQDTDATSEEDNEADAEDNAEEAQEGALVARVVGILGEFYANNR